MAYMSQERKKSLAFNIKTVCKLYGIKATLGVRHHSTLELKIKSGPIDFIESVNRVAKSRACGREYREAKDHVSVNPYCYKEHYDGIAKDFLTMVIHAMNVGNHDNSDAMTDYFDVGWYISVDVGNWQKPYELTNG
jgi:hypothetical protein